MALKQHSVRFILFLEQCNKVEVVVPNRVCILVFVLNRVRVSNPQRLTFTQITGLVPPSPGLLGSEHPDLNHPKVTQHSELTDLKQRQYINYETSRPL